MESIVELIDNNLYKNSALAQSKIMKSIYNPKDIISFIEKFVK